VLLVAPKGSGFRASTRRGVSLGLGGCHAKTAAVPAGIHSKIALASCGLWEAATIRLPTIIYPIAIATYATALIEELNSPRSRPTFEKQGSRPYQRPKEKGMDSVSLENMTRLLVGGSATDEKAMARLDTQSVMQILPDANVIKVGGQSFIDRGREAVFPLIQEIVENLPQHKMIIGTGAGTRARHAYSVGLDLGMPTGVLSVLGFFVSIQNAKMVHYLLAKHGIPSIEPAQFAQMPLYLAERRACVCVGMPPYAYWQPNPELGRIPPHRTDTGCYLISETLGARSMIYVKDEEGLYTADPKKDRNAKFIPKIAVDELLELDLGDVVLERVVFDLMKNAKNRRSVQIINGLKKGNLTRALNGEPVGTIITV
jgi:molybdenum storage protein